MIRTNLKIVLSLGIAAMIFSSCGTTAPAKKTDDTETIINIIEEEPEEHAVVERREARQLNVKTKTNEQETEFINKLKDLDIKLVSSPKGITQSQNFKQPFSVKAENSSGPVADLDITVSFPSSKTTDSVIYDTVQLKTDANGVVTFKPETPAFAVNDKVTFYPSPVNSNSAMVTAAYDLAVTAPWKVKTQNIWYPGLVYVYDFNESGNPTTNSTSILTELRNSGFSVGNSPISNSSYCSKSVAQLYKDTFAIVGNSCRFMIAGTVKYANPVVESAEGFTCSMIANITCIEMKTGNILSKFEFTESVTDSNKWKSIDKCKATLSKKVAEAVMYGM